MSDVTSPIVVSDRGDIYVFDDPVAASADIEAIDAVGMEFYDAAGHALSPVVDGHTWSLDANHVGSPEPDRVLSLLHSYFARLPARLSRYVTRAEAAATIDELVHLWRELASEPGLGRGSGLFGRFRR